MAKKRLTLRDKQGNVIDYDISAARVTIDAEGKSLEVKLSELVAAIAATTMRVVFNGDTHNVNGGTINLGNQLQPDWAETSTTYPSYIKNKPDVVTGIKVGASGTTITPTNGVVTIPESGGGSVDVDNAMSASSDNPVANRVIKAYVDNLINGLINGAPAALDTLNELSAALGNDSNFAATITQQLALKANDANVVKSISVNGGAAQTPNNGNVNLVVETGGLAEEDIDVTTQQDGVVVMTFGNESYSINLNHSHTQYLQAQVLTQSAYDALTSKDSKTLYFISDGNKLYLGSSLVLDASNSGGGGGDDPTPDPDPEPTDSLPSGYTALEWLNGNGAVEINTSQAIPFDVETKFAPTDLSGYSVICGRVSSLMVAWNAQGQAWVGNANSSLSPAPFALNTDAVVTAKFRADSAESEVKINGTDSGLHRATSADSSAFSILSNGSSYKAKGKLYYLKVYNASSGTLEKHLVPALDDNNTPCLYDIIGQTKYTFSGTVSSITTNLS